MRRARRFVAGLCSLVTLGAMLTVLPVTHAMASTNIPDSECYDSPFGRTLTLASADQVVVDRINDFSNASTRTLYYSKNLTFAPKQVDQDASPSSPPVVTDVEHSVGVELDGDGRSEIVRAYQPHNTRSVVIQRYGSFTGGVAGSVATFPYASQLPPADDFVLAAGNFEPRSTSDYVPRQQVAYVSRTDGSPSFVDVNVMEDDGHGNLQTAATAVIQASSSLPFGGTAHERSLAATAADVDGDGQEELVIAVETGAPDPYTQAREIRFFVLKYSVQDHYMNVMENGQVGIPGDPGVHPAAIDPAGTVRNLRIARLDINNDWRDDVAVAYEDLADQTPTESHVHVATVQFRQDPFTGTDGKTYPGNPYPVLNGSRMFTTAAPYGTFPLYALGAGEVNGDGNELDDVVLAYAGPSTVSVVSMLGVKLSDVADMRTYNQLDIPAANLGSGTGRVAGLALAVGDVDGDIKKNIVVSFRGKDGGVHTDLLADNPPGRGMTLQGADSPAFVTGMPTDVTLVDENDTSLRSTMDRSSSGLPVCADVTVPSVTLAMDSPPYWKNLQDAESGLTEIGHEQGTTEEAGSGTTTTWGDESSFAIGGGVNPNIEVPGVDLALGLEVLAGHIEESDHSHENTRESTTSTYTSFSTGWGSGDVGRSVGYQSVRYRCYFYRFEYDNGTVLPMAQRVCAATSTADPVAGPPADQVAPTGAWDAQNSQDPDTNWVPTDPEWANLALFLPPGAASASSIASGSASAVVGDRIEGGSSLVTGRQDNPWWQVDLGSSKPLSSVRIWRNQTTTCGTAPCDWNLGHFEVFVFNNPSLTSVTDPAVMQATPGVVTYDWSNPVQKVTNVPLRYADQTPVTGRFIRIQKLGQATSLSLSQVQVYGADKHLEPDQFPAAVQRIDDPTNCPDQAEWQKVLDDHAVSTLPLPIPDRSLCRFTATLWNPVLRRYENHVLRGDLAWAGGFTVGGGNIAQGGNNPVNWEMTEGQEISNSFSMSEDWNDCTGKWVSMLSEFLYGETRADFQNLECSGNGTEWSHTSTRDKNFTISGWRDGLYTQVDGHDAYAPDRCLYSMQPFYYYVHDQNSDGGDESYMAVSYLVPQQVGTLGLNRNLDLSNCQDGVLRAARNVPPSSTAVTATTRQDRPTTIDVVANAVDPNPEDTNDKLKLEGVLASYGGTMTRDSLATAAGGTVTIMGDRTVDYSPPVGFTGTDTFYVKITDGADDSTPVAVNVTVTPERAPMSASVTTTARQGVPEALDVLSGVTDPDGDAVTLAGVGTTSTSTSGTSATTAAGGAVVVSNSKVTYTPPAGFTGTDTFWFRAYDGMLSSAPIQVVVTVTPERAPTAAPVATSTRHDLPVVIDVMAGVSDADGDPVSLAGLSTTSGSAPGSSAVTAAGGTAEVANGKVRYTPKAGFVGTDTFWFQASDGFLSSPPILVSVSVTDLAPTRSVVTATTAQGQAVAIALMSGVTDGDGDPVSLVGVGTTSTSTLGSAAVTSAGGSAVVSTGTGSVVYTPPAAFAGTDTFWFKATDGALQSAPIQVSVTVTGSGGNHPPTSAAVTTTATQDQVQVINVLSGVTDADGDPVSLAGVSTNGASTLGSSAVTSSGGSAVVANGQVTYTPKSGFVGTDTFWFQASDGKASSAPIQVTVTVNPRNLIQNGGFEAPTSAPWMIAGESVAVVGSVAHSGNKQLNAMATGTVDQQVTLPAASTDTLTFWTKIMRYLTSSSVTDTMKLQVIDGATTTTVATWSNLDDTNYTWLQRTANLSVWAGRTVTLRVAVSSGAYPTSFILDDFALTYTGGQSGPNNPPASLPVTVTARQGQAKVVNVMAGVTDPDGDPVSLAGVSTTSTSTLGTTAATSAGGSALVSNGTVSYTPPVGFTGTDTFWFKASDGKTTSAPVQVTVTVTAERAPSSPGVTTSVSHDRTAVLDVMSGVTDPDGDPVSLAGLSTSSSSGLSQSVSTAAGGVAQVASGRVTYIPRAGFTGTDSFWFQASDGILPSAPVQVTVNVTDQAPARVAVTASTGQGQAQVIDVMSGVTDADGDSVSLTGVSTTSSSTLGSSAGTAAGGTAVVANGKVSYTPPSGFSGSDTFWFKAGDGILLSAPIQVTVTVTGSGGARELVQNGGFEAPTSAPWVISGESVGTSAVAHGGSHQLVAMSTGTVDQQVSVPAGTADTLTFWNKIAGAAGPTIIDTMKVQVVDGTTTTTVATWSNLNDTGFTWTQRAADLSAWAGKTVNLRFAVSESAPNSTLFILDDVSLMAS